MQAANRPPVPCMTLDARPRQAGRFCLPCGCPIPLLYPHNETFALLHLVGGISLFARLVQRYIHGLHKTEARATEARAIDDDVVYWLLSGVRVFSFLAVFRRRKNPPSLDFVVCCALYSPQIVKLNLNGEINGSESITSRCTIDTAR